LTSVLFERLCKSQRLPSPSAAALKILQLADREDASISEVSNAIIADPAITARILKYANSPLVGPRQPITTIPRAVTILGIRAVKVTALGFSLVKRQDFSRCPNFNFDLFWAHATATATAARGIVAVSAPGQADEAFVAGLLSRIGKLAFATAIPEEYDQVLAKTGNVMRGGTTEERAAFGTDNIEIGAEMLAFWKLPTMLVEAVRLQSNADAARTAEVKQLASAVAHGRQIADILCGVVARQQSEARDSLRQHNLAQLEQQFREMAGVLSISLKGLPDPEEIEGQARGLQEEMSVATQTENTNIKAKNQQLERLALVDSLTGIGNRMAFDQRLDAELARARRCGRPVSLLMMDIDGFKQVNDTHGHVLGDAVLRAVSSKIQQVLRAYDFAARYGGDEIAVIAGETSLEAAVQLAERLRAAIQGESIATPKGPIHVTVSIGVASVVDPTSKIDPVKVVIAADRKLYEAKKHGRNQCCHVIVSKDSPVGAAV